ncbi:unnamed protein product [Nesidiocoris tenuis]|uniref:Uncharacterized protein n=1 Tax=Nesidiocoris tenuis TaxID=355587 RepID=A0A6H5G8L8_9HEMI|nr:unnamed protein product [Nesidiocoris tenuis]
MLNLSIRFRPHPGRSRLLDCSKIANENIFVSRPANNLKKVKPIEIVFIIWRIEVVSLRHLRWDQKPGASSYHSSGFWTGSSDCIHMHMGFVPYPQGQELVITHPPSSRKHLTPNPTSGRQMSRLGHTGTARVLVYSNCRVGIQVFRPMLLRGAESSENFYRWLKAILDLASQHRIRSIVRQSSTKVYP